MLRKIILPWLLLSLSVCRADDAKLASSAGRLLSEKAVVHVSSTCQYDAPETHLNLVRGNIVPNAFHTASEKNPWVTLKLPAPAEVRGFEVINRAGQNSARAATLTISLSTDGKEWKEVWSAGGQAMDKWNVILPEDPARPKTQFVKLELKPEKSEYLHLSRVSIYGH